jgi:hypothetical protein
VDAARTDDDQQAVVDTIEDGVGLRATPHHDLRVPGLQGDLIGQRARREQRLDPFDALIAQLIGRLRARLAAGLGNSHPHL